MQERRCPTPNELQMPALNSLGKYKIIDRKPDGRLTVRAKGAKYIVDCGGRLFKKMSLKELRKQFPNP
jgi:hypothetical protein